MTQLLQEKNLYLAGFEQLDKERGERDPSWLRRLRKAAMGRFQDLGFPTTRNEDWRFTNLARLASSPLPLARGGVCEVSYRTLPQGPRLVFFKGNFLGKSSTTASLPAGTLVMDLKTALKEHPDLVEPHLARHARYQDNAMTALNTALIRDGAFVYIPKNAILEHPIHLLYLTSASGEGETSVARNLVVVGAESQATIVEEYLGQEENAYFVSTVTEIAMEEGAIVDHCKLQEESLDAFHIANTHVVQARGSKFSSHYISLGGGLVRNETRVLLDAENCEATVNGLYIASGKQHVDNFTVIDHAKPNSASHELYKGILTDHAHAVFNGKIFVRPDAQKTDAKQTNQVLLLSDDAVINTKPQLEIFADDVKCTHGATVGQLQEEAIFYLRSRGVGLNEAKALLTFAFANDIIGRIKIDAIRERLEQVVLAGGHLRS